MRLSSRAFCSYGLKTAALLCVFAAPAHAGMSKWMDEAFTFRREQKPLVVPHAASTTPQTVYQPYYDDANHDTWSSFYTRPDLEAQDYLSSSASKVMRPAQPKGPDQSAWETINERGKANAATPNIAIGEPGQGPGVLGSDAQISRKTTIGEAVKDWRLDSNGNALHSRAGDYDYRVADTNRGPLEDGGIAVGENISATAPMKPAEDNNPLRNDKRYTKFNEQNQVTGYEVQRGDTLSNISAQPAIYGKSAMWPLIYSANRKVIGGSPKNLKQKQQLVIPRDYTETQAKEAMKKAK